MLKVQHLAEPEIAAMMAKYQVLEILT